MFKITVRNLIANKIGLLLLNEDIIVNSLIPLEKNVQMFCTFDVHTTYRISPNFLV